MHNSSSNSRPRQRTFTSCTECRRRKQRCNQAKDRPCNNCSRRYPPVNCTYESSASSSPSHDHVVDFHDMDDSARHEVQHAGRSSRTGYAVNPAYQSTSQSSTFPTTSTSSNDQFYDSTYGYYSSNSRTYQNDASNTQSFAANSTLNDYTTLDDAYYSSDQLNFGTAQANGYYSNMDAQGNWLTATGDPTAFVGAAGSSDLYYVGGPDPQREQRNHESDKKQ